MMLSTILCCQIDFRKLLYMNPKGYTILGSAGPLEVGNLFPFSWLDKSVSLHREKMKTLII